MVRRDIARDSKFDHQVIPPYVQPLQLQEGKILRVGGTPTSMYDLATLGLQVFQDFGLGSIDQAPIDLAPVF